MKKITALLLLGVLGVSGVVSGCGVSERRIAPADSSPDETSEPRTAAARPISDTHPMGINDYLIYPVKWGRAEDVAQTIEPLLRSRYGPDVRVIPHVPTNKLLIYLPPEHLRQRSQRPNLPGGSTVPSGRR